MLSNQQQHRLLPPPSYYCTNDNHHKELESYYEQWKSMYGIKPMHHNNEEEEQAWDYNNDETVFGLSFVTSSSLTIDNSNDSDNNDNIQQTYLAGCTKSGEICVWMINNNTLNNDNDDEYDNDENNNNNYDDYDDSDHEILLSSIRQRRQRSSIMQRQKKRQRHQQHQQQNTSPIWKYKLTNGALYDCQFVKKNNSTTTLTTNNDNNNDGEYWFIVSGDGGVYLFDWDYDILEMIRSNSNNSNNNNSNIDDESIDNVNNSSKIPKYTLYPTYPSFYELNPIEINQSCIICDTNVLYGAGGDTLCYKWDMNTKQIITTYRHHQQQSKSNHFHNNKLKSSSTASASGYLQTIVHVPNTNLLISGGEDGILFIWDIMKDQLIESIHINNDLLTNSIQSPPTPLLIQNDETSIIDTTKIQSEQQNHYSRDCWISSCIAQDENWCLIAGGCYNNNIMRGGGQSNSMNQLATTTAEAAMTILNDDIIQSNNSTTGSIDNSGGFITTFHIPTRTFISSMKTKETISKIIYNTTNNNNRNATTSNLDYYKNNNNNNNTSSNHLLSISNESYVTHWMDPFQLYYNNDNKHNIVTNPILLSQLQRPPQKVKCTTPSGYGIATNIYNNNNQIAVSGIGHIVDVYDHSTQLSFHLTTKKEGGKTSIK